MLFITRLPIQRAPSMSSAIKTPVIRLSLDLNASVCPNHKGISVSELD